MRNYYPNFFKQFIHIYPLKSTLGRFWQVSLDFLFPRKCLGCDKNGTWLCPACLDRLPRSYSPTEDKIFSVFEYGTPVMKQVIWRLKYKRSLELAETLARPMYETLIEELCEKSYFVQLSPTSHQPQAKIILIPAPLSPARYRSRGYNQAEELARQIARLNPDQFEVRTDIIKKIKDTPTQVSIKNREARLKNLKDAFVVRYPISQNKTIFVIVDDVSTTGATISEIHQLLARSGCRNVYGLVVAHG
ncbi:MAG: ComF family protein [Candidatus Paceibacterota bacterium]